MDATSIASLTNVSILFGIMLLVEALTPVVITVVIGARTHAGVGLRCFRQRGLHYLPRCGRLHYGVGGSRGAAHTRNATHDNSPIKSRIRINNIRIYVVDRFEAISGVK